MANQHFFQPLLPGFHSHLTIPVAFFIKNVEGNGEKKTAKLRSDASKATWEVKIDGQKLTQGWKEFAVAHDLRIGDIVIFRQEKDMTFHVTMLGPSCCEIQHVSCLKDQKNLWKIQRKKRVRTNPRIETESCFVGNISASTLRFDRLDLPRGFVRKNGLGTRRCRETASSSTSQNRFVTVTLTYNNVSLSRLVLPIPFTKVNDIKNAKKMSLMDKQGVKWPTKLFFEKRRNIFRLGGGWKEFCEAKGNSNFCTIFGAKLRILEIKHHHHPPSQFLQLKIRIVLQLH